MPVQNVTFVSEGIQISSLQLSADIHYISRILSVFKTFEVTFGIHIC
jgi:hypothetical protein